MYVWTITARDPDCTCLIEALCQHGWVWYDEQDGPPCRHEPFGEGVYSGLADALRDARDVLGWKGPVRLLRRRTKNEHPITCQVFVYQWDGASLVDDHDASPDDLPNPLYIIQRDTLIPRHATRRRATD